MPWVSIILRRLPVSQSSTVLTPPRAHLDVTSMPTVSTEYPASSCTRGKPFHPSLLLLVVDPLHTNSSALKALPVPPDSLAEMLRPERSSAVVDLGVPRLPSLCARFAIGSRCRCRGGRRRRKVGLFLVQLLDPLTLHSPCALDDVADEDLGNCTHAYDDIFRNGLRDGRIYKLMWRLVDLSCCTRVAPPSI